MNKKAETMGVKEIIYIIIGILIIIAVITLLYRVPIETMLGNLLPNLNGSSVDKYDEITGKIKGYTGGFAPIKTHFKQLCSFPAN